MTKRSTATYAELARACVPRLQPADDADLEEFAETSAGRILVPEWGNVTYAIQYQ